MPSSSALSFLQHLADEDVDDHHALQVGAVLGEADLAAHVAAAEQAGGAAVALDLGLAGVEEGAEYLDEVGAVERLLQQDHAQCDASQPRDVDRAGEDLRPGRQPLLGDRRARRSQREGVQIRLMLAVERGQGVDEGFVLGQLVQVALGEQGAGAQADLLARGRCLRGKCRVQDHLDLVVAERRRRCARAASGRNPRRVCPMESTASAGRPIMSSVIVSISCALSALVTSWLRYWKSGRPYNSVEHRVNSGVPMPPSMRAAT